MRFGGIMIPPLIVTLIVGMALQPLSTKDVLKPGLEFAGRTLLRIGVALYGAQLTLGQLVDGGPLPMIIAIAAVGFTIMFGAIAARTFGLSRDFGLLTGCVTGVNFISTVTMVVYPPLHTWLGYSPFETGVFLGGAIHDVAQIAGAGETLGKDVLTVAIITKLLRVACLLPAVTVIAWWVARGGEKAGDARPAPPVFLFGFLLLAFVNSVGLVPPEVRAVLAQVSSFLIIAAIAALGIKTSLLALVRIGMAPVMLLLVETVFIGLLVVGLIYGLRGFGI